MHNVLFMKMEMKKSIIFSVLIFVFMGCSPLTMDVKLTEINRITSPDSRVDAVIVTSDAGATTSIGHHIPLCQNSCHLQLAGKVSRPSPNPTPRGVGLGDGRGGR